MTLTLTEKTLLADIVDNGALRMEKPPNQRIQSLVDRHYLLCIRDHVSSKYEITDAGRLALHLTRSGSFNERQLPLPGIATP